MRTWHRVVLDVGADRHALFGIGRSSLGGIVVDVGAYLDTEDWIIGVFDLPPGQGPGLVARLDPATKIEPSRATKLHYHPSGFVSADQTGRSPKADRTLAAAPMLALHGEHVFTVLVIDPASFPIVPGRRITDLIVGASAAPPRVLKFVVYLTQYDELDPKLKAIRCGLRRGARRERC